jgi:hypothetical protein
MHKKIVILLVIVLLVAGAIFAVRAATGQTKVPAAVSLPVPFTTQAPDGNWVGNENCEETSVVMANAYLTGNTADTITPADAVVAINNVVQWENANIKTNANTGAADTAKMAAGVEGIKAKVINNYTELQLKQALAKKEVVLLPIDATKLNNPNYTQPPPTYHMVVLRGYSGDTFYINDPGLNQGDNNAYSFTTLQAAGADWNNNTNSMDANAKPAIVLSK